MTDHSWAPPPLWPDTAGYLNTATYGLPPRPTVEQLNATLDGWRAGTVPFEEWDQAADLSRRTFARLIGADPADVAIGATVSQMLAPIAGAVPDGGTVLVPEVEFTSNIFPWAVHADRGVKVETAPLSGLLDAIRPGIDVVSFSLVQSSNGVITDPEPVVAAAHEAGALAIIDATQACGWLPVRAGAADAVLVSAYKWLMGMRGTAFGYLAPALRERLRPVVAGWFAGEDPHGTYYSMPLRLAGDARAFDLGPAWQASVATGASLAVIEELGVENIHRWNVGLANRFLTALDRPPGDSAIVVVDVPDAGPKLAAAGIRAAARAGRLRASFHASTTVADVDAAVTALRA